MSENTTDDSLRWRSVSTADVLAETQFSGTKPIKIITGYVWPPNAEIINVLRRLIAIDDGELDYNQNYDDVLLDIRNWLGEE